MNPIDSPTALLLAIHLGQQARVWKRVVNWIVKNCASDEEYIDPAAQFSIREWADLPMHHPASDE